MNSQEKVIISVLDVVKRVFSVLLLVSGVSGFYYLSEVQLLYKVLGLLVVVVLAAIVFFTTESGVKLWSFFKESKLEVNRVVWPTRDETVRTTLLVFAMVIFVGLLLGVLDKILFEAVKLLTGQKG